MAYDEAFLMWRTRHVVAVERQIGDQPGTGGSSGADYLRRTLSLASTRSLELRTTAWGAARGAARAAELEPLST